LRLDQQRASHRTNRHIWDLLPERPEMKLHQVLTISQEARHKTSRAAIPVQRDRRSARLATGIEVRVTYCHALAVFLEAIFGITRSGRYHQNDKLSGGTLVGTVAGQTVLILDDLCATGETLARAAKACHQAGAAAIHVAVTHTPVPAGIDSVEALDSISGVVVTDSTGFNTASSSTPTGSGKRTILPIAPLFGQATRRLLARKPLSPLLERWPISFEE
jgi:phosphoribosylpyrophosphate synthetase